MYVFFAGYVADLSEAQDVWMIALKGNMPSAESGVAVLGSPRETQRRAEHSL